MNATKQKLYWTGVPEGLCKALESGLKSYGFIDNVKIASLPMNSDIPYIEFHTGRRRFGQDLERFARELLPENKFSLNVGRYILEIERRRLWSSVEDVADIVLTDRETDILAFLARAKGQSIGRDHLLHSVWGYNNQVETHTLETHIYRLRQKLELDPSEPEVLITTEDGYCLKDLG